MPLNLSHSFHTSLLTSSVFLHPADELLLRRQSTQGIQKSAHFPQLYPFSIQFQNNNEVSVQLWTKQGFWQIDKFITNQYNLSMDISISTNYRHWAEQIGYFKRSLLDWYFTITLFSQHEKFPWPKGSKPIFPLQVTFVGNFSRSRLLHHSQLNCSQNAYRQSDLGGDMTDIRI